MKPNRNICTGDGGKPSLKMLESFGETEFHRNVALKAQRKVAMMPPRKVIWMAANAENEVYREAALARVVKEGLK